MIRNAVRRLFVSLAFIFSFVVFIPSNVLAATISYLITEGVVAYQVSVKGEVFLEKNLIIEYKGGQVIFSSNPDGTGATYADDAVVFTFKKQGTSNIKTFKHEYETGCANLRALSPKDLTSYFSGEGTYEINVKIKDECGYWAASSAMYLVNINAPEPSVSPTPTSPEPFLDLPWNYDCKQAIDPKLNEECEKHLRDNNLEPLTFKNMVLNPGSWFDHEYPTQESGCCSGPVIPFDGIKLDKPYHTHNGYDFNSNNRVNYLTPILAAASGKAMFIKDCGDKYKCPLGNYIKIDHENGYQTWYAHLDGIASGIDPNNITDVRKGQLIAYTGFSGNIWPPNQNGAHLHFSVFQDSNNNGNFNDDYPYGLVDPLGWEGDYPDPWTKWPSIDALRRGANSYYLYLKSLTSDSKQLPETGGNLEYDEGRTKIEVPNEATDSAIIVKYKDGPFESFISDDKFIESIVPSFFLDTFTLAGEKITEFDKAFKIIISYSVLDVYRVKEQTLILYYFDEILNKWVPLESVIDTVNKTVTAFTTHNSHFALMGESRDKIPPITQVDITGEEGNNNWYRSNIRVELVGSDNEDGVGFNETLYTIDGANWLIYDQQLEFTEDGRYKIDYQSSDIFKNIEDIKITEFKIDKTVPNISISADRESDVDGWYNRPVTFKFAGEDEGSGIEQCSPIIEYKELDNSNATVEGNCTDKAGNIATVSSKFKYDSSAPELIAFASSKGNPFIPGSWTNADVQVEFHCIDENSGVKEVSDLIILSSEGKDQSVKGMCEDNAGNKSEVEFSGINIDKTTPEAEIVYDLTDFDVKIAGIDNLSLTSVDIDKSKILLHKYTIKDQAGNTLVINANKVKLSKQVAITIKDLKYNSVPVIGLEKNVFFTLALTDKTNTLKQLDQYFSLKDDKKIFTLYTSNSDITKIYSKTPGVSSYSKEEKSGVVLLKLETENGKLKYSY